MKTLNPFLKIIFVIFLFNITLLSQLKLSTYTDKDVYEYGEIIELFCKVTNTADTTFEFFAPTYQSCQAEFSFNDFNSWEYNSCLATTELLTFLPHHSKIYSWRIEPISFGLPNKEGAQTIIGKYFFDLADTIYIQAPKFVGGEVSLSYHENNIDTISSISNQLNADIVFADHFGEIKSEIWQIEGYDIDSLIQIYSNNSIFITFEKSIWIMYENIVDENPLDYYPLQIGNKWYYEVTYYPIWDIGSYKYNITKEVIGNSTFKDGKKYFEIKETRSDTNSILTYFERIDSVKAQVYRLQYAVNKNDEFLVADFHSELTEFFSTFINYSKEYEIDSMFLKEESYKDIFSEKNILSRFTKTFNTIDTNPIKGFSKSYSIGIGKTHQFKGYLDAYDEYQTLKAAFIDGHKYGDTILVGIKNSLTETLPKSFSLSQNYPNPFNPTTTIGYSIPSSSVFLIPTRRENNLQDFSSQSSQLNGVPQNDKINVALIVYDVLGRKIKTLVNQQQNPGKYSVQFDGSDLVSGIYYYRLTSGNFSETKKLILLK